MPDINFDSVKLRRADDDPNIHFIIAFDVLQILGLVLVSITLCASWFSSRVRRSRSWFSYTFAWVFSCISYLLILRKQTGPSPDPVLCLCQAMLIYAFPPLVALSFALFTLEIFLSISSKFSIPRSSIKILYFVPYGVFTGILITVFVLGRLNPTAVRREPFGMFCHLSIRIPLHISSAFVICSMTASLILTGCVAFKCHRRWNTTKILLIRNGIPISLVFRAGLICVGSILAIGLSVLDTFKLSENLTVWSNIVLAMLPVVIAILFGSQGDILSVLMFWRKPPPLLPNTSSVTLDTPTKTSVTNMITQSYHDFTATSTNTQPQDGSSSNFHLEPVRADSNPITQSRHDSYSSLNLEPVRLTAAHTSSQSQNDSSSSLKSVLVRFAMTDTMTQSQNDSHSSFNMKPVRLPTATHINSQFQNDPSSSFDLEPVRFAVTDSITPSQNDSYSSFNLEPVRLSTVGTNTQHQRDSHSSVILEPVRKQITK